MNWLIRGLFQPTENRYWVGKRLHLITYLFGCIGIAVVFVLALVYTSWTLAALGAGLVAFSIFHYFVLDHWSDKLMWKHFYKRHYGYESPLKSDEYEAIKQFDKQPTAQSQSKVEETLKEE